jgi:BioD-like phosphotransacetylase family protein
MKALYITSVEPYSGKTAVCLAVGHHFQKMGHSVGYLKPVSTQPWRTPEGRLTDEDANFVRQSLGIEGEAAVEAPVIITDASLNERLEMEDPPDLLATVLQASEVAGKEKDILLIEGGGSLRQGYAMGLSNLRLADQFGAPAIVLVRYRYSNMQLVDDALAAQFRLGDLLLGVIFNQIPEQTMEFVQEAARPYLEHQGVNVLGALPRVPRLSALSVGELLEILDAAVLTDCIEPDALVETFTVGAMTLDAALSRFRRQQNKAVITGGDRSDIQLAALETSTVVLILTGNLQPSPIVIKQAEALGVPVLLVPDNTMETVDKIEGAYGKTRLGQPEKLETFLNLMAENVDYASIQQALDISS